MTEQSGSGFVVELRAPLPVTEAMSRVLDLRAHGEVIPLTRVSPLLRADELAPGSRFVGRTGFGPIGFDDLMEVRSIDLGGGAVPASAVIVKLGRVIGGTISVAVTPSPGGCVLHWEQSVRLPWLPRPLHPAAAVVLRAGYRRVLKRLLARARP